MSDGVDVTKPNRPIKCVVWDLDNTLWLGTLMEDVEVRVQPDIVDLIRRLDEHGVLNSVASRNDHDTAWAQLVSADVTDRFVEPQIHWDVKSRSMAAILEALSIAADSVVFVDDDPFERDEVGRAHPDVRCLAPEEALELLERELRDTTPTGDARERRRRYQEDALRRRDEAEFEGPSQQFLESLGLRATVWSARPGDLDRAAELTVRTNQLNTTGRSFGRAELGSLADSEDHDVVLLSLEDRYGSYGTVGLAVEERRPDANELCLFLMSCRVLSRGIGGAFLWYLATRASSDRPLLVHHVPNDRNRPMSVTLRLAGFREVDRRDEIVLLRAPDVLTAPRHVELVVAGPPDHSG